MSEEGVIALSPSVYVPILVALIAFGGTVLGVVVGWMTRLNGRLKRLED